MQIEVLGERYQLQDPIGRGGMATIYRGRDLRMDRVVAIKVLREVYSTDPKFVTRFQREAKAASSLQHPNIVQVYDYGQSDGNYFIVMELIEGTDLRRYLRSRGILAVDRAIIIAHDVALGLGAAHRRNIVHRDVKPQNVLVGRDGSIKLTDFGIASVYKDINAERLTTTGMTLGTVQYYAPEQAQGEIVSPAADVYALGIVLYEMLTGRTPFDGDTPVAVAMQHIQDVPMPPSQFNPNIPPALENIIMRCLEKVPEMRFRDGSTLARALETLNDEELASGVPPQSNPGNIMTPMPNSGGSSPQLPQRPITGGGLASSPNNRGSYPYNLVSQSGTVQDNGVGMQPPPKPMSYPPLPGMMGPVDYNNPALYNPQIGGAGSTRPFQRDALAQSGVAKGQRDSRFASIVTILIVLATLLLLGFSIYLAAMLNFLTIPGITPQSPDNTAQWVQVPDLKGKTLTDAQSVAASSNLKVKVIQGPPTGVVSGQAPEAGAKLRPNSEIQLEMQQPISTVKVPDNLVNGTLDNAMQILKAANIAYVVKDAGNDSTYGPSMVIRTDPAAGQPLQPEQRVTLYVVNQNVVPTVPPQPTPQPTPTVGITPTPTTARPTPTPTMQAKPTPTPKITPTPTTGVTPTVMPTQ